MSDPPDDPPKGVCPVDHTTRSAWLANSSSSQSTPNSTSVPPKLQIQSTISASASESASAKTCDSSAIDSGNPSQAQISATTISLNLNTQREISSIPRAIPTSNSDGTISPGGNLENIHAQTSRSGNWIYPSEAMFFAAMKRKNWDPKAEDMRAVVPIHNAVNERAWHEIKNWEAGRGSEKCGGPKLVSFSGDSSKLTPKARFRCLLGYTAPFDRHDWVVDRCGKQIEYVIDFYSGKKDPKRPEAISFYLDVRPKINSVEGVCMRVSRAFGNLWS